MSRRSHFGRCFAGESRTGVTSRLGIGRTDKVQVCRGLSPGYSIGLTIHSFLGGRRAGRERVRGSSIKLSIYPPADSHLYLVLWTCRSYREKASSSDTYCCSMFRDHCHPSLISEISHPKNPTTKTLNSSPFIPSNLIYTSLVFCQIFDDGSG